VLPAAAPSTALTRTRTKLACATITCSRCSSRVSKFGTGPVQPSLLCSGNGCQSCRAACGVARLHRNPGGGGGVGEGAWSCSYLACDVCRDEVIGKLLYCIGAGDRVRLCRYNCG